MDAIPSAICLGIAVLYLGAFWQVFTKAGEPGWAILVPFYNIYVLLKISGKPGWWMILMFIPIVNIVISILTYVGLAEGFGKGVGFTLGLILFPFIFIPILGFGSSTYGYFNDGGQSGTIQNEMYTVAAGSPLRTTR